MRTEVVDGEFVKRVDIDDEDGAARLTHEAEVLERVLHPGVVELRRFRRDDVEGTVELRTAAVAGPTIRSWQPAGPLDIGRAVASLATTVADLHELGVAHGRLTADHVLLDGAGRPVLCGFAGAVNMATGDAASGGEAGDERAADDVGAVGRLLLTLLETPGDVLATLRDRDRDQRAPGGRPDLASWARHATVEPWTARPTARDLAEGLWTWVEQASRTPPGRTRRHTVRPPRRALASTAAAAVACTVVVVVVTAARRGPRPGFTNGVAPASVTSVPAIDPSPPPGPAPTVEIDGRRLEVGRAGDRAVTGRFDCRDTTAAVLTSAGEVFVFDQVPTAGADTVGRLVGDADPAATLSARDANGDGCDELVAATPDGAPVTLDPRAAP